MPLLSPPTLQYADLPSRWGISVQRSPAGFRVVVPPLKSWRFLPRGYVLAVLILGGMSVCFLAAKARHEREPTMLPKAIIYGSIALVILAKAVWRLRHQTIIDVTRDELAVEFLNPRGRGERTSWPKGKIGDVKFNAFNGKLLIRITGDDLIEYPICPQREVTRWVAGIVRSAVFEAAFSPGQAPETAPAAGAAHDYLPAPRPPAYRRAGRYVAAIALAILAIVGMVLIHLGEPSGMPALLVAGFGLVILCGITYGTQEKEIFT